MKQQGWWCVVALALALGSGCAQEVGDIDRTQPNKVLKSDLTGTWYMVETVTEVPAGSAASFVGETGRTEKIRWEVQESLLLAYRSYPLAPGSDNVDGGVDYDDRRYTEQPVAAYAILSHFDVVRDYATATGEQSNVVVENTSDRPWFERSYMRVDWSRNLLVNFDFLTPWLTTPIQASYTVDAERGEARGIYFERDARGELAYFDLPQRLLVEPDLYGCIISSPWYGWGTEDCASSEIEVVTAFARTPEERDYEPQPYTDQDMTRFGYFRSERYVFDPQRGVLESTRSRYINRHNIWKNSYQKDAVGRYVRNADGARVPIPVAEREVKAVPYYLSAGFPEDALLREAAAETMAQWDAVGREAVAVAQGVPVEEVPEVFALCHNPVEAGDSAACGEVGFAPRPGDLRYSVLGWVEAPQQLGPLGYGPAITDPETGEILSGRAFNYGEGLNTYASYGVDVVRFANGDLSGPELVDLDFARAEVQRRARATADLDRVAPELKAAPLAGVRDRSPERLGLREARRRTPRAFAPEAVTRRLEAAEAGGLGARLGGNGELGKALGAHLGAPVDGLPEDVRAALSPVRWLNPTALKVRHQARRRAMARSVDLADMIDPNVLGLARAYAGRTDYDTIWRELRAELFKATALHEVGHSVGLRHNFQASYDALNYHPEYWALRTETMRPLETMFDLYASNGLTEAQLDGRMREFQYASIMDYGLTFNSDWKGLGRYDRAALVYGYTAGSVADGAACDTDGDARVAGLEGGCLVRTAGFVETFAKPAGALGEAGEILTSRDEYGFTFDDPTSVIIPWAERWHYTTLMQGFPAMEDAFDRRWTRLGDYAAAKQGEASARLVRVPYLFCSDEWEGALLSCRVFDGGADPFELTQNIINDYRSFYWFVNFKRDRLGWDPIDALYRYFFYSFLPLSDVFQSWYLAPEGADEAMDNYWWIAINAGFNLLAEVLATPPYGTFCEGRDGSLVHLSDEPGQSREQTNAYYLDVYCKEGGAFYNVPQGEGRRRFSVYDVDSGYNYGFLPLEAGHYWATLAAFWALVDPEAYVLGTDADVGTFAISYYDFFDQEIHQLVNAVMTEDYNAYSPVLEITGEDASGMPTGRLRYPVLSPVYDSARALLINPEDGSPVDAAQGPPRARAALCEPCGSNADCNGHTGSIGGTFCQPIDESGALYCLQDCTDDAGRCEDDEVCDDAGNCVPEDAVCDDKVDRCGRLHPLGQCPSGEVCVAGGCEAIWPVVETDATFALVDDMMFYGMLYTTFSYSARYNDQINVFKMGTGEEVEAGEGFEVVSFVDPISGERYGAVAESCGDASGATGGPQGICAPCLGHDACAGYTGELGGTYCQPLEDGGQDYFCFLDCTDDPSVCGPGFTCDGLGNCVPQGGSCDGLEAACGPGAPLGTCAEGSTCVEGTCVEPAPLSPRCAYQLATLSGAAQLVLRGQELVEAYNAALEAYWSDDGSDAARELSLYRAFSRARFDLEGHLSKINVIRAVYAIFGKVY